MMIFGQQEELLSYIDNPHDLWRCISFYMNALLSVTRDVLLVGRAKLDSLEGGTHEETLRPQVNPKVKCKRFEGQRS